MGLGDSDSEEFAPETEGGVYDIEGRGPVFLHTSCAITHFNCVLESDRTGDVLKGTICEYCGTPIGEEPKYDESGGSNSVGGGEPVLNGNLSGWKKERGTALIVHVIISLMLPDGRGGPPIFAEPVNMTGVEELDEMALGASAMAGVMAVPEGARVFLVGSLIGGRASVMMIDWEIDNARDLRAWTRGVITFLKNL